jgi:hypothetical protein
MASGVSNAAWGNGASPLWSKTVPFRLRGKDGNQRLTFVLIFMLFSKDDRSFYER